MANTRIKVCGITRLKDAEAAVELGVSALGFVFSESPRRIEPQQAQKIITRLPPFIDVVGVFTDEPAEKVMRVLMTCHLSALQFHGKEAPQYLSYFFPVRNIKSFRVRDKSSLRNVSEYNEANAFLFDTYHPRKRGGTGKTFNWNLLREAGPFVRPVILSGGLTADNVAEAIAATEPYAVDVSSGVESKPGTKDARKMRSFVEAVRATGRA